MMRLRRECFVGWQELAVKVGELRMVGDAQAEVRESMPSCLIRCGVNKRCAEELFEI
jgi:hypothetical protein